MSGKQTVAVIGCGLMGCDVASIFLAKGWQALCIDSDVGRSAARLQQMKRSVEQLGGTFSPQLVEEVSSVDKADWSNVEFGFEAVPENFEVKSEIFAALDRVVPAHIPLMTNTSGLRITEIARECKTRNRMGGLHFFLPAHLVPAVEVVRGEFTEQSFCDRVYDIMKAAGRVPIRVSRDVPGFLANRIQHALMREAFAVIDEGLGTPEDVDAAVRFSFGFRYIACGPILQKELSGLQSQVAAARAIYPSLHNNTEPSRVLTDLVAKGHLGTRSGQGFWTWTPEQVRAVQDRYERTLLAALHLLMEGGGER